MGLGLRRPLLGKEPRQARAGTDLGGHLWALAGQGERALQCGHGALAVPQGTPGRGQPAEVQGRIVQVFTMHAEPRTATLVSANGNEARVRARMEGGHADYRISRDSFVRALLVQ